jgi:tetratricopeptide (TPR) repeat protein
VALVICGVLTFERSKVWGNEVLFWTDTVAKSPRKMRGYSHLTVAYIKAGRCADAVERVDSFPPVVKLVPEVLGAWGSALECAKRPQEAIEKYERAAKIAPSVGRYLKLAMAYHHAGATEQAEQAASQGLRLEPRTPYDRLALSDYQSSLGNRRSRIVP